MQPYSYGPPPAGPYYPPPSPPVDPVLARRSLLWAWVSLGLTLITTAFVVALLSLVFESMVTDAFASVAIVSVFVLSLAAPALLGYSFFLSRRARSTFSGVGIASFVLQLMFLLPIIPGSFIFTLFVLSGAGF